MSILQSHGLIGAVLFSLFCVITFAEELVEEAEGDVALEERFDWNLRPPRPKPRPNTGGGGGSDGSGGSGGSGETNNGSDSGAVDVGGGSSIIVVGGPINKASFEIFSDLILTRIETELDCFSR